MAKSDLGGVGTDTPEWFESRLLADISGDGKEIKCLLILKEQQSGIKLMS